jgi:prefoldin subunit 5
MTYESNFDANSILKKLSDAKYEFDQATEEVHKNRKAIDKARKKQDAKIKELQRLLEAVYKQSEENYRKYKKELEAK